MPSKKPSKDDDKPDYRKLYLSSLDSLRRKLEALDDKEKDIRRAYSQEGIPEEHFVNILESIREERLLTGEKLEKRIDKAQALKEAECQRECDDEREYYLRMFCNDERIGLL